jgi:MraZ protein
MLLGEYEHAIDDKGRITVPAKLRSQLESGVVVTKGIDRCLWLFPNEGWADLAQKASALPLTNPTAREFQRQLFGAALDSVPDKQGRIILHPRLREYANIDNQAVIIGMSTYCEIWNPESWRERMAKSDEDPEWRAKQFADLGI